MVLNTPEGNAPKTTFQRAVAFLQRDVRSFLPDWKIPKDAEPRTSITTPPDSALPSFVDLGSVDFLAFRREVLDWRDGFHTRVTMTAIELRDSFARKVRHDLADLSIFRRMFTHPARDRLQDPFIRTVRVPMMATIQEEQLKLAEMAMMWLPQAPLDLTFSALWSASECNCLGDLDFTPQNEEKILEKIEALLLGDNGIVDNYRTRATQLARKIIEERAP